MRDVGNDVENDFEESDEDEVDGPGTCGNVSERARGGIESRDAHTFGVDPFRVEVGQSSLIADVFK